VIAKALVAGFSGCLTLGDGWLALSLGGKSGTMEGKPSLLSHETVGEIH